MENFDLDVVNEKIKKDSLFVDKIKDKLKNYVIGQDDLIEKLIIAII